MIHEKGGRAAYDELEAIHAGVEARKHHISSWPEECAFILADQQAIDQLRAWASKHGYEFSVEKE